MPIQIFWPLAAQGWRWMGEAERAAMTPKYWAETEEARHARAVTAMVAFMLMVGRVCLVSGWCWST